MRLLFLSTIALLTVWLLWPQEAEIARTEVIPVVWEQGTVPKYKPTFDYNPTKYDDVMTINWVSEKNEVQHELDKYYEEYGQRASGLALWQDNVCTIWVHEPNSEEDFNVLGKEVAHCFRGKYHK